MNKRTFGSFLRTLLGVSNREKVIDQMQRTHEEEHKIGLMVADLRVEAIQEAAKQMSRLLQKDSLK